MTGWHPSSQYGVTSFCAWVRVVREGAAVEGVGSDGDLLSLISEDVIVIYLGPSFCLFPLTDCAAFWKVESLGTLPTNSPLSLALGTNYMLVALSLASCQSVIASAARLPQVLQGASTRSRLPPVLFPRLKWWRAIWTEHTPGGKPLPTCTL